MTPRWSSALASRPSRWLAARTLRGRLIAGLLALLAVACATVGFVTYTHLHSVLLSQLDAELAGASSRYNGCLTGPPDGQHGPGDNEGDADDRDAGQPQDHDGAPHPPAY